MGERGVGDGRWWACKSSVERFSALSEVFWIRGSKQDGLVGFQVHYDSITTFSFSGPSLGCSAPSPTQIWLAPTFTINNMSNNKPLFSTLRFVSSNDLSSSGKRRIAQRACDSCRRRKKRCFHGDNAVSGDADADDGPEANDTKEPSADGADLSTERHEARSETVAATSHPRYIGDLNPEVELLAATTANQVPKNSTGVWHSDSVENGHGNGTDDTTSAGSILHGLPLETQQLVLPALQKQCLESRPPKEDFVALERYYFERIHPVLPSIDDAIYRNSTVGSPSRTLQEQSICLLASTGWNMRQHLRIRENPETLGPTHFARKIVSSMRLIIDLALVSDKTVLIYVLTTMSLFVYGRECLELTSQYFFQAVQIAYSIGLHQPRDAKQDEKVAGLFSYLWSIDRLLAAIQGRPVVMHEVDMAKSPLSCASNQEPAFKVLVHIAVLVDKVIGLYRPTAQRKEIPDEEFPLFEEVLEDCNAMSLRNCDQGKG